MEITTRELWTLVHGMGFGALYLLAFSGAFVELGRRYSPDFAASITERDETFLRIYFVGMAVLAWALVLTGAYIIYPWYRAVHPDCSRRCGYIARSAPLGFLLTFPPIGDLFCRASTSAIPKKRRSRKDSAPAEGIGQQKQASQFRPRSGRR